jgi:hypothetical protein
MHRKSAASSRNVYGSYTAPSDPQAPFGQCVVQDVAESVLKKGDRTYTKPTIYAQVIMHWEGHYFLTSF